MKHYATRKQFVPTQAQLSIVRVAAMEPHGGLPPDIDRQLVVRAPQHATTTSHQSAASATSQHAQQQLVPMSKPTLTLNLPHHQQALSTIATSPAVATLIAASGGGNHGSSGAAVTPALASTAIGISATTQAATAFSGSSVGQHIQPHHHPHHVTQATLVHHPPLQQNSSSASSSMLGGSSSSSGQQTIDKLSRPMAFDKMESLVREMQDPDNGVPVRQQKMFLTSIPYAFMGYDLIEWLMDRLLIEESEALNIANQLCLHGYFFPVNDTKTLTVKDDSSLYRFQTPYYWPWQHKAPDNVEYAIYLAKRSLRNKQRHALEDYEAEALASLHKNLKGKWDFISMQAEEQVRLAKERKKGDKIVGDSQERAYWRVHRPPPGQFTPLEPCPIPSRDRPGTKPNKKKSVDDVQREVDYLSKSLNRTRMKMSQACESLVTYSETFTEFDFFLQPVLPSNPWVTEDITFWQLNNTFVDVPTEKRVKRWAISIEELVCDPTGLQEFTSFLEKEYSHENIRFWIAVNRLRRSAHSQVVRKVNDIYEEFLKPGAPCEINIDGKTMESVLKGLKNPSRFTFDSASDHIYMLLLKKDCYPRFVRSDHYKRLLETGIQPSHKKRFFNFGGVSGAKKKMTAALSSQPNLGEGSVSSTSKSGMMQAPPPGNLARRRGSDRSLTGSAHELAVIGVNKDSASKVPHSHSQSNLSEIPYSSESIYRGDMPQRHMVVRVEAAVGIGAAIFGRRESSMPIHQETPKPKTARLETTVETAPTSSAVCPWDLPDEPPTTQAPSPVVSAAAQIKLSICPWEQETESATTSPVIKTSPQRLTSTSSDITDVSERMQRNLGIRHQNTVDSGEAAGIKRLIPNFTEQRRASVSFTPSRNTEYQFGRPAAGTKTSSTPSPTVNTGSQSGIVDTAFPPLFTPLIHTAQSAVAANAIVAVITSSSSNVITKDPPSSSDAEIEEELTKLAITERHSEPIIKTSATTTTMTSELPVLPPTATATPTPTMTPTPPPITKITPPPPDEEQQPVAVDNPSESVTSPVATEVEEVQIELIEATEFEPASSPHKLRKVATPTIQVQEPAMVTCDLVRPPSIKTPKKLHSETEFSEVVDEVLDGEPQRTAGSVTQTPEDKIAKEIVVEQPIEISCMGPPPVPEIGPMEEEAQLQKEEHQDDDADDVDDEEAAFAAQEELSPTTDEYQEGMQFGGGANTKDVYDYDIVDTDEVPVKGCIAPTPTPAPTMAPLAELDIDTVDDELCEEITVVPQEPPAPAPAPSPAAPPVATPETQTPTSAVVTVTPTTEEVKKRRKKRNSDGKKMASLEEKDKAGTSTGGTATEGGETKTEADRNTVCPWEDENVSASDGTFVKTYATLGYL